MKAKTDYLFSLRGNQGILYVDVQEYCSDLDFSAATDKKGHIAYTSVPTHDEKHGRIEDQDYVVSDDVAWLHKRHPHWKTIQSIEIAEASRAIKGEIHSERRYFISSLPADAEQFAKAVRAHWGIENILHYVLDVTFGEDATRIRKDQGPENMAILRKLALTAARSDTETKSSIIGRRKQMAWSNEYLERLFFHSGLASSP